MEEFERIPKKNKNEITNQINRGLLTKTTKWPKEKYKQENVWKIVPTVDMKKKAIWVTQVVL